MPGSALKVCVVVVVESKFSVGFGLSLGQAEQFSFVQNVIVGGGCL